MHRIDADSHVANMFDEGDPGVPRNPTQVDADWLNAVQEEICNAITNAGITLVKGTNTQLRSALVNVLTAQTIAGVKSFTSRMSVVQSTTSPTLSLENASTGEALNAINNSATSATVSLENTSTGEALSALANTTTGAIKGANTGAGAGVLGTCNHVSGYGTQGVTLGAGSAVNGDASAGTGIAGQFIGNSTKPTVMVTPQSAEPSAPSNGGLYYDSDTHKLRLYAGGAWVDLN